MQANVPDGPGEWRDLNLILTVLPETKAFVFGGYLKGNGSAWFDDIRFDAITASAGKPSPAVRTYLNKAISLVKKHALVRDSIPWKETEATMFSLATGMQSEAEAHTVVAYLLNVMRRHGDNHSHFQRPVSVKNLYADKPAEDAPKPEGRYLGEGVGYVAVPRFWGVNSARETEFTEAIQRIIQSVDTAQATVGWVVDLRKNQGGNMWPMIAGLRPLIGEGTLGYFVSGKREQPWTYKSAAPKSYTLRHNPTRIAVLIGPQTASSGEMTALSFIGLPTVRTFGLKSGGYTTANQSFTLPDGAELYLAVSGSADRTKKTYPHGIVPDEEVKADSQGTTDATLAAAKAWLTSSK
ncbi:MAG: hypothetical protein EOO39_26805 [Cytophagaceae bacterium]|nr:MAG: hypothetical protein EOO39_26805 [Cytophagaceae bacterium]